MSNLHQRDAFLNRIYELGKEDSDIIVVSADMGAPALDQIRKNMSSQFINAGIAEQNATVVGAGLAMGGKKVLTYAIAPFITMRCLEQIRICSAMMGTKLGIVGVGVGFGYEDSGPTHHLLEDIAIMRCLPKLKIRSVTDSIMAAAVADEFVFGDDPIYIRLERQLLPDVYEEGADFSKGMNLLQTGKDGLLIGMGATTHSALKIADEFKAKGKELGVLDLHTLPVNLEAFHDIAKDYSKIITIEEQFLPGGLGSVVCEALQDVELMTPVKRIGMDTSKGYCYIYGGREVLRGYYDMDYPSIVEKVDSYLK